jgi:hypothetical protein
LPSAPITALTALSTPFATQEIEKKKRELKGIKNKNRLISQELEMKEAQQSWKKFVTKVRPTRSVFGAWVNCGVVVGSVGCGWF